MRPALVAISSNPFSERHHPTALQMSSALLDIAGRQFAKNINGRKVEGVVARS